jgi:hypothetical protein
MVGNHGQRRLAAQVLGAGAQQVDEAVEKARTAEDETCPGINRCVNYVRLSQIALIRNLGKEKPMTNTE